MAAASADAIRAWASARLLLVALGWGFLSGCVLDVLTFLLARYGPSAGDAAAWSFRGNGALLVPFGLGPAVLAAGWTALVSHGRLGVRWLRWSVAVGVVGAAALIGSAVVPSPGS